MSLRSRNKVNPNFNMSSMTDIVFLLLIFFMLTSTLVSPNALKLLLPNSAAKTLEKQTVSISIKDVSSENTNIQYYVNGEIIELYNIEQHLKTLLKDINNPGIVLNTDQTISIDKVVNIMDIAYRNDYKIVLATKPK